MKLYGAIDLHSNNNVTVLIDEQDQVVYQKRLPNDLPLIVQQLSGYRDRLDGIVVESTFNWYWLVDGLGRSKQGSPPSRPPSRGPPSRGLT
jgi:transposase